MTVNKKTFNLSSDRACISGRRSKEKYMAYQDEYRQQYGVYPELDRINKPFTAKWDDVYTLCCQLRRPGLYGALYFHDLHARYRKKLKKVYEKYSKEWSFLISIDLENRSTFTDIPTMEPGENIVGNLGWRKDENGNYYEGTWQDGKLIYGLVYLADQDIFFAGSFDESGTSDCFGVSADLGCETKGKRQISTAVGGFRFRNNQLSFYSSTCLLNVVNIKNDQLVSTDSCIGEYVDGYREGTFISKEISDEVRVDRTKYREDEVRSQMSFIEMVPRTLMMFYVLIWYMVKYVHCSGLLITPLYYYFRKKNWRI